VFVVGTLIRELKSNLMNMQYLKQLYCKMGEEGFIEQVNEISKLSGIIEGVCNIFVIKASRGWYGLVVRYTDIGTQIVVYKLRGFRSDLVVLGFLVYIEYGEPKYEHTLLYTMTNDDSSIYVQRWRDRKKKYTVVIKNWGDEIIVDEKKPSEVLRELNINIDLKKNNAMRSYSNRIEWSSGITI